ncbi:DAK2 domain-containing protein [Teichococcus aestuarii]
MTPRLGRASYLGARALGTPDAGAAAVLVWMRALAR